MVRDRNYVYRRMKYARVYEDGRLMWTPQIESSSTCSEGQHYWILQRNSAFKTNSIPHECATNNVGIETIQIVMCKSKFSLLFDVLPALRNVTTRYDNRTP